VTGVQTCALPICIVTSGYSMGWYDIELVKMIVKIALGIDIKTLKQ